MNERIHLVTIARLGVFTACLAAARPSHADPETMSSPSTATVPAPAPAAPRPEWLSAARSPPATSGTRDAVALGAAGVALAGVATAVTFGVLALQSKSAFDKNPTYATSDKGNNDAAYADGGFALAVCAGATSLVLWLTRDPASSDPAAGSAAHSVASFSAFVTSHGGSAGALVHF